jgi:hypothetical protein
MFIYVNNFQAISAAFLIAGINFDIYNVTGGSLRESSIERDYFPIRYLPRNDERGAWEKNAKDLRNCLLTYNNKPFKCEIIVELDSERTESLSRARAIVVNWRIQSRVSYWKKNKSLLCSVYWRNIPEEISEGRGQRLEAFKYMRNENIFSGLQAHKKSLAKRNEINIK